MKMAVKPQIWQGCYDDGWKGLIVPDAFAHPAKFARGLIERIIQHGFDRGYWNRGDTLGDPFGGVALGGVVSGYHHLNWIGVELEPRFVALGNQNIMLHAPKWCAMNGGASCVKLIQGDSRKFAEIVRADSIVTSPPYAETGVACGGDNIDRSRIGSGRDLHGSKEREYGQEPGQIGALKSGEVDAVVTSPPYAANEKSDYILSDDGKTRRRDERRGYEQGRGCFRGSENYGDTEGQIGREREETYWQAMAQVYTQCLHAMKPGGYIAVVLKDYVKNKARVPLCDQSHRLLLHLGFEPVERIHAMLTKTTEHAGLFATHKTTKSRKSFFRRLAEKNGSPAIDWEEVLIVRRPA